MTDKQQRVAERDFNRLWDAVREPVRALNRQVADLSRQAARAEVAGAVEVVSSLGSAGKKGRLAYLTTDDQIYYDDGTSWVPLGGGVKVTIHNVPFTLTQTISTSYVNVTGSDVSHSFTRDNALVVVNVMATGNTSSQAELVPQVDGVDGTTPTGLIFATAHTIIAAAIFTDLLEASDPATVRMRLRSSTGQNVQANAALDLLYIIVEF